MFLFGSTFNLAFAQQSKIDSLNNLLPKASDVEKISLLHEIHSLTFFNEPEASLQLAKSAEKIANKINKPEFLVRIYQDIGVSQVVLSNIDSALYYFNKGLEMAKKLGDNEGIASCTNIIGTAYWYKNDFDKAQEYYEKSLELFIDLENNERIANCYSNLGTLNYAKGSYEKSIEYYLLGYEMMDTLAIPNDAAVCLNDIGTIYKEWGNRNKALSYFLRSLNLNTLANNQRAIAANLDNIGSIHFEEGNFKEALAYFKKGEAIEIQIENYFGLGYTYLSLSSVYQKTNQTDSALFYLSKASDTFFQINNKQGLAQTSLKKGEFLLLLEQYNDSKEYLNQALNIAKEIQDVKTLAHALSGVGIANYFLANYTNAISMLLESNKLAKAEGYVHLIKENYNYLAKASQKTGNKSNEANYLREYIAVTDSIYNLEKQKQLSELLAKYETDKKETEIELLNKEQIINQSKLARQRFIIIASSAFLAIMVFFIILIYKRYKEKKLLNNLLTKKNKEIEEKQKEIESKNLILQEQKVKLEELDNLKSRFFTNISHEFRTPLTLIMGPLDQLLNSSKNDDIKPSLQLMMNNSHKLMGLINQLIEISRIEKGVVKINFQKGNISKEIAFITEMFTSHARDKGIDITYSAAKNIEGLFDKDKVERILFNLISNALKNTTEGFVNISITQEDNDFFEIIVTDTGKGIEKAKLPYIFDRFYMIDNNIPGKNLSSGIGLAFVKELVMLYKGQIMVDSEVGKGTEFRVKLPLITDVFSDNEFVIHDEKTSIGETFIHQLEVQADLSDLQVIKNSEKVLVVEDHEELRAFLCSNLVNTYNVIQAENGRIGIEMAIKELPDIIITDVMMPEVDGFELVRTLKNNEETSHIPIIILTAKASEDSKIQGLEIEADDYLTKPFSYRELSVRIQNLLKLRQKLREKYKKSIIVNPSEITSNSMDEKFIARILKITEENMANPEFSVDSLCSLAGISRSSLHNKIKSLLNQSTTEFINTIRVKRAAQLIKNKSGSISEIAYDVGFNNLSYFNRVFKIHFNVTPSEMIEE